MRRRVLFLCTHNSARSQMAEGILRDMAGDSFEAYSAGSVATRLRDEATIVMKELGIELSGQESKTLDRFLYQPFDLVVTVCDRARDTCPVFPNAARRLHWSIADPAAVRGADTERLTAFRVARDELERLVRQEIVEPATDRQELEHFRSLERMYLSAPTNAHYRPRIAIGKGVARVTIEVRPEFFHAAGGVHGSVYFKALDDACFFAANSLVTDVMVLTSQFSIQLVDQISEGRLRAVGRVEHAGRSSLLVEGALHDAAGKLMARGQGTFVKSRLPLDSRVSYGIP